MRLTALDIVRLPGIRQGFTLDGLAPGVNVVIGPNASGKTSLLRALRAALYPEELRGEPVHVEAHFEDESSGASLTARRIGRDPQWQRDGVRAEAPPLPDHRLLSCYTLRIEDLLDAEGATDAEIAGRLARELAGGYDIDAVRGQWPFVLKRNHGKAEADALSAAERGRRQLITRRRKLAEEEARLAELRGEKEAAQSASHEADRHERALELLEVRRERRALEERGRSFPDGIDQLQGDELDTLAELRRELEEKRDYRTTAAQQRAVAVAKLNRSGLAETELDEGALSDRRRSLNTLLELEPKLETDRAQLAEGEAEREAAIKALGGEPNRRMALDPQTIAEVEQVLERKRSLEAEVRSLEHERKRLPEAPSGDLDPERLRPARRELLRWLAAASEGRRPVLRWATAITVVMAGGAGIAVAALEMHRALAALALPLVAGAFLLARRGRAERRRAERNFAEMTVNPPDAWTREAVQTRLDGLDRAVVDGERRTRGAERREEINRELAERRMDLEAETGTLRETAAGAGHDPDKLDASLQRWIRLVADYDAAHVRVARCRAALERDNRQLERERGELVSFLQRFDEAPPETEPGADTLASRLDRVGERLRQRDAALRDIEEADRELERLDGEIDTLRQKMGELFARCGLESGDDAALRERVERRSDWRELQRQLETAAAQELDRAQRLGDREDLRALVDADDEDTLRRQRDELRERAGQLEALVQEITRIEGEIERAGQERRLEAALAEHQRAGDALHERLDEALFAEAGQFLVERVEAEHEEEEQPPALQRAKDWFARFTHHQYALELAPGDDGRRFAALETATGERRGLAELSSGTRMQLLLAVRIAFAVEAERDRARLPLILDEALTTADPERFDAAAEALTLLAADGGRQVFYLTAQPDDAGYWRTRDDAVRCIDLAELRGRGRAGSDSEVRGATQRETVPAPDDRSAEDYAAALGVPALDPWADAGNVHLFHLLRDDLDLLHRLLRAGVDRLGPLESLVGSPAAASLVSDDEKQRLAARAAGARAWLEAWRTGRGQPVDRDALERSGAVSGAFIDRVAALAEQVGGDGRALIERLAAGEVKRFKRDKREELEQWLTEQGYIDAHEPLDDRGIDQRAYEAVEARLGSGDNPSAEADGLTQGLRAGLAASPGVDAEIAAEQG